MGQLDPDDTECMQNTWTTGGLRLKKKIKLEAYFPFLWDIINTNIKLRLCLHTVDHIGPVLKKVRESYLAFN